MKRETGWKNGNEREREKQSSGSKDATKEQGPRMDDSQEKRYCCSALFVFPMLPVQGRCIHVGPARHFHAHPRMRMYVWVCLRVEREDHSFKDAPYVRMILARLWTFCLAV